MVASPDFQDFTQGSSRLMQQLAGSPVASIVAGVNSVTLPVPDFARSLNLLVTVPANVITLTVVGATTGFTYLNAVPAYDGGIYYLPAMPVVDSQITVTWYQVDATSVSIYAIASDEPISVSVFNPVSAAQAVVERLEYGLPQSFAANQLTSWTIALDSTTSAIRCTVDIPANVQYGSVIGIQSGKVYYDGQPTGSSFPSTPIPVSRLLDTSVHVNVRTNANGPVIFYSSRINTPDFSGNVSITAPMSPNELVPNEHQSETPNQLPATYNGTFAANAINTIISARAGIQLRLHGMLVLSSGTSLCILDLQATGGGASYWHHFSSLAYQLFCPLFGLVIPRGSGVQIQNSTAIASGNLGLTLYYSVL